MMYSKQEKQMLPLIAAAFLLGLFSLNPLARADSGTVEKLYKDPAPKGDRLQMTVIEKTIRAESVDRRPAMEPMVEERDGMSLGELNRILREPLQVRANEQKTDVSFLGDVPARCVYDENGQITASIDYDSAASKPGKDGKEGVHVFRVHMPLCERDPHFKKIPGEKMVKLSTIPGARALNDVKGKVVLASGYKDSDADPKLEELKDRSGEAVVLETEAVQKAAERAAQELQARQNEQTALAQLKERQKEEAERAAKREAARIDHLAKLTGDSCKAGDIDGMETAIGNIPELREDISKIARRKLLRDLDDADSADAARTAWDAIQEAGERFDWEDSALKKAKTAYVDKRFSLLSKQMEDGSDVKAHELDHNVADWADELARLDSHEFKKHKGDFAKAYGFLAANASDVLKKKSNGDVAKSVREAEKYYGKAMKYADAADRTRAEGAMAKLNGDAYKACVRINPLSPQECDASYRQGVKKHGEKYVGALAKRAEKGDEEAKADVANFARDYLQAEGFGASYNFSGFGTMHQMPGAFEQFKLQSMKEAQMRMVQQYQQQMMSRMYGGMGMGMGFGMNMGLGGMGMQRTSFFGF